MAVLDVPGALAGAVPAAVAVLSAASARMRAQTDRGSHACPVVLLALQPRSQRQAQTQACLLLRQPRLLRAPLNGLDLADAGLRGNLRALSGSGVEPALVRRETRANRATELALVRGPTSLRLRVVGGRRAGL